MQRLAVSEPLGPPLHFDAMITPHRSLSLRGFTILFSIVAGVNFIAGIVFVLKGAWPIFGFCGLDVLLLWWAFRRNYRAARAHETVQLSDEELRIRHVDEKGSVRSFSFQPYWVRLDMRREADQTPHLHLKSRGEEIEIASLLSPKERADFARALDHALQKVKGSPLMYDGLPAF